MHAPYSGGFRRSQRLLVFAGLMLGAMLVPRLATAHAVLLEASPHDYAIVAAPPREIRLRFNEIVTPALLKLLDSAGKPIAGTGPIATTDTTVVLPLPATLAPGVYLVTYRVTSADSHPVGGSFVFGLGVSSLATADGLAGQAFPDEARWAWLWTVTRAIFDLAALLAAGGVIFRVLVTPRAALDRGAALTLRAASFVATATGILQIAIRGAQLTASPLFAAWPVAQWGAGFATSLGLSVTVSIAGLLLIALTASRQSRGAGVLSLLGSGAVLVGFALTGHAATAPPIWLSAPLLALHVLCAAFWLGALPSLYLRLRRSTVAEAAPIVTRFSRIAVVLVALLLLCGVGLAVVQLRTPSALLATPYGQRLIMKLGVVASLLAVAGLNQRVLTPALTRSRSAAAWLRGSIAIELILFAAIITAATLLGQVVPPREVEAAPSASSPAIASNEPGFVTMAMTGEAMADVAVTPARPGANHLAIDLSDAQGAPTEAREVTVWLSNPGLAVEPRAVNAVKAGPGHYIVVDALMPMPGDWTLTIEALISDFEQTTFTAKLPIPSTAAPAEPFRQERQ